MRRYIGKLKKEYGLIPYLAEQPINNIFWDCQETILKQMRSCLEAKPHFVNTDPFFVVVQVVEGSNACFDNEMSTPGQCRIAVGVDIVVSHILSKKYLNKKMLVRLMKEEEELAAGNIPMPMGLFKMDLGGAIAHEMLHYYSMAQKRRGSFKSMGKEESKGISGGRNLLIGSLMA